VLTASVLTVSLSVWLEREYGWPAHDVLPGLAFAIGMGGDRWKALGGIIVALVTRRAGGAS